jgi:hypothetical protein
MPQPGTGPNAMPVRSSPDARGFVAGVVVSVSHGLMLSTHCGRASAGRRSEQKIGMVPNVVARGHESDMPTAAAREQRRMVSVARPRSAWDMANPARSKRRSVRRQTRAEARPTTVATNARVPAHATSCDEPPCSSAPRLSRTIGLRRNAPADAHRGTSHDCRHERLGSGATRRRTRTEARPTTVATDARVPAPRRARLSRSAMGMR